MKKTTKSTTIGFKDLADGTSISIEELVRATSKMAEAMRAITKTVKLAEDDDGDGRIPTGDAAEISITNDRKDPRIPWIKLSRWSFSSFEDWKMVCDMAGQDPTTTETVTIYVLDTDAEPCPDGETISPDDEY